jgi:polyisoprenoid-binding protein YceI
METGMKAVGVLALALLASGPALAADWKVDPAASRLEFIASFEKTAAPGVFREFDARLARFEPDKPEAGKLDVTVKVTSADMKNGDVNRAIRGPEWFDFARFPQAEFHAEDIRRTAPGRYLARGMLSLKGVKKELEVPFTWQESGNAATMEGEVSVERLQFGIGTGEWANGSTIGLGVRIKFNVRLRKES